MLPTKRIIVDYKSVQGDLIDWDAYLGIRNPILLIKVLIDKTRYSMQKIYID